MTVDGNWHYAKLENQVPQTRIGIAPVRCKGLRYCTFKNLLIINSADYAIGFQSGGYIGNLIEDLEIFGATADGIYVEDNGSISIDNVVRRCSARRGGKGWMRDESTAAFDIGGRSWVIEDCEVSDYGAEGTLVMFRIKHRQWN